MAGPAPHTAKGEARRTRSTKKNQAPNTRDNQAPGTRHEALTILAREAHSDESPACRYGVLTHREAVIDESGLRREARHILQRIRDGAFARESIADQRAGHPRLTQLTGASHALQLGVAERRLRTLPRIRRIIRASLI